jgi:NAD-dependent dihydropyrimidine dehydrogenase PreA subunit
MKRQIIKIDDELCNGCGLCVDGCHEGALQLIDGKARLISELYCDGLGACIGDCPVGAIEIEEREAEEYDEIQVIDRMIPKGIEVIKAHLKHLADHQQHEFIQQGIQRLKEKGIELDMSFLEKKHAHTAHHGGCPGSMSRMFGDDIKAQDTTGDISSKLRQWPVQLHLINPGMPMFDGKDVLLAADCVPFAMGDFHKQLLEGKMLAIACPKLDSGKDIYVEKLVALINERKINTLTVAIMEVPCCHGLLQLAQMAVARSSRKIPVKCVSISIEGKIIEENWV